MNLRGNRGRGRSFPERPLIVALDVDSLKKAKAMVDRLYPVAGIFKIGSELFTACGPKAVEMVHAKGAKVFLDLKFHDIPNTVANAIKAARAMGVFMLNIHASGGREMMRAAYYARGKGGPILLAVTVLTSLGRKGLLSTGVRSTPLAHVKKLALLAKEAKLDGVVCSPREIETVRRACGRRFIIVTPGIRPAGNRREDQKRAATPSYAIGRGANYIVVGRPITRAKSPLRAARAVLDEIGR